MSPVFKKRGSLDKENYRPVSILSHMSKAFERMFYKQINNLMTSNFSPFFLRMNHNSQYSLLKMMEIWKKHLDKGDQIGIILINLSKAFDMVNHSLLLAKLEAYRFCTSFLKSMQSSLCNRFKHIPKNLSKWVNW